MTPEQHRLDPQFFLDHRPTSLYRLAAARYASLSGIGAANAPGRWNHPGQEAIYTSTEVGVPVLERLVHTSKNLIPSNLALMKIRLTGDWEPTLFDQDLRQLYDQKTGAAIWICSSISEAKSHMTKPVSFRGEALALAVPSVILPVWNVVLLPKGKAFWQHVFLESVEPFEFDARLFPEDTPSETRETG